jgi:hypothetical protein
VTEEYQLTISSTLQRILRKCYDCGAISDFADPVEIKAAIRGRSICIELPGAYEPAACAVVGTALGKIFPVWEGTIDPDGASPTVAVPPGCPVTFGLSVIRVCRGAVWTHSIMARLAEGEYLE